MSSLAKDDALRNSLQAAERVAQLQSEKAATENELKLLQQSRAIYRQAIDKLNGIYDQGYLRANMTGIVGAKVPLPGQVVKFSDELMQINGASPTSSPICRMNICSMFKRHAGQHFRRRPVGQRSDRRHPDGCRRPACRISEYVSPA